jgi:pentatricopeptide repeat protein
LLPREESYGIVIHSLAVSKRTEEAGELFLSMESGQFRDEISPGRTSFDGRMLAYMEANAWEETLAFHSKMKEAGIPWSPLCFQGVLLASYRLGGRAKALETIEGALESGMKMDHNCCEMSIRIILGDVLKIRNIQQVRTKLRHIGEQNQFLQSSSLNLSRALRSAEVEERRQPTDGLKLHEIVSRRDQAWNSALKHLVLFARAIENEDLEIIASK